VTTKWSNFFYFAFCLTFETFFFRKATFLTRSVPFNFNTRVVAHSVKRLPYKQKTPVQVVIAPLPSARRLEMRTMGLLDKLRFHVIIAGVGTQESAVLNATSAMHAASV
jgi:hypothetical protein